MQSYLELLRDVLENGTARDDRTGVGTLSVFGRQLRFNLGEGFPLLTTKKINFKAVLGELLWFLSGSTSVKDLHRLGVHIWDPWAREDGELGPVYGKQWRAWETKDGRVIDQLARLVEEIKSNPTSRRLLVSAWNVGELEEMVLPPCHYSFQFYVAGEQLSLLFNMRSVDLFIGLPFNIASYALLTHMVAQQCGLRPHELVFSGADVHLYRNHIEAAREQLRRKPYPLPELRILRKPPSLFDYRPEDFELAGYKAHPHIKVPVAV